MAFEYLLGSLRTWKGNWKTYTIVSVFYILLLYALFVDLHALNSFLPETGWWGILSLPFRALLFLGFVSFGSVVHVSVVKMAFEELRGFSYIDKVLSGRQKWKEAVVTHLLAAVGAISAGYFALLLGLGLLWLLGLIGVSLASGPSFVEFVAGTVALVAGLAFSFIGPIVALEETGWKEPLPVLRKSFEFVGKRFVDSFFLFLDFGIIYLVSSFDERVRILTSVVLLPCLVIAVTTFYVDETGAGLTKFGGLPAEAEPPKEDKKLGKPEAKAPKPEAKAAGKPKELKKKAKG